MLAFDMAADDMEEMVNAVKHAIQQCCLQVSHRLFARLKRLPGAFFCLAMVVDGSVRCLEPDETHTRMWNITGSLVSAPVVVQLKVKIQKKLAAKEQQQRRKNLTKYIPNAAAAIFPVLESMAQNEAVGRKRRWLQREDELDMLGQVKQAKVSQGTLVQRLTEYVERIDTDLVRKSPRRQQQSDDLAVVWMALYWC